MPTKSNEVCFILSAGIGSRMGEIGKQLPKPLWMIGNLTLIEATKNFWQAHGLTKFYANVHHCSDKMIKHLEKIGVIPVVEKELLGSGGAYYNLKKNHPELESVLAVNSDSFPIKFSEVLLREFIQKDFSENRLLSMPVKRNQEFNRLIKKANILIGIENNFNLDGVTYAGVSKISLDKLPKGLPEVHGFFDSVANYDEKKIIINDGVIDSFLDFGTVMNFYNSYFELQHGGNEIQSLKALLKLTKKIHRDEIIFVDGKIKELSREIKKGIIYNDLEVEIET